MKKTYNIVIAESDTAFSDKLIVAFKTMEAQYEHAEIKVISCGSLNEIAEAFSKVQPHIAFIDCPYFLKYSTQIEGMYKSTYEKCQLVMMIPDEYKVSEVVDNLKKHETLYLSGYLLKGNYSTDLISLLVKNMVEKII
jgi:hypothetical protein